MKKQLLLLPVFIVATIAGIMIATDNPSNIRARSDYETFILDNAKKFENNAKAVEGQEPGEDRPDEAAFSEFVKTLDPELKRVPAERRFEAMEETREISSLKSSSGELKWKSHQVAMGGRTRTLMFDPNDPTGMGIYAGAVTGGLWYNANPLEENKWSPINDYWPNLAVSCMTYDPQDTKTMYIGTGESQTALIIYRESSTRGAGIMKSTDGGIQWDLIPSTSDWAYVTDILIRVEDGTSVIYAGVVSGIYKGKGHHSNPSDGLYRSADGGETWAQVLPYVPGTEMPYAPSDISLSSDNSRLFVGTTYGINSSGTDLDRRGAACILYSDDGFTWNVESSYNEAILNNETAKYPGRVMLANSESDPNITYAIIASGYPAGPFLGYGCEFLLKSTDKGESWEEINFPQGFASLAWHAFAIAVNPDDPDIIWLGGLDVWRTTDGGTNWRHLTNWAAPLNNPSGNYVHADIHVFLHNPANSRQLYVGTDGGVFFTGSSLSPDNVIFHELNDNCNTLQYYSAAIHPEAGLDVFSGGLQDNGTLLYRPGQMPARETKLSGGDGALCFIDQDEPEIHISTSQYTTVYLLNVGLNNPIELRGLLQGQVGIFINPMDYDWKNNKAYCNMGSFTGENVNTIGCLTISKWNMVPEVWEINTNTNVAFSVVKWDEHTGDEKSTLYLGTISGQLFKLENTEDPESATEITGSNFPLGYISSIDIGQSPDTLLVTFSNYGVSSVWMSTDGGENWSDIDTNLPDMPIRCGIFHPESSDYIMLATETGTWVTSGAASGNVHWKPEIEGMANVRVEVLKVRRSDNTVLAATHGRGMYTAEWKISSTSSRQDIISDAGFVTYPNPTEGEFHVGARLLEAGRLTIVDSRGKIILEDTFQPGLLSESYDLSREPAGTYIVSIITGTEMISRKILVK